MSTFLRASVLAVASFGFAAPVFADKPDDKSKVKVEFRRAETEAAEGLIEAKIEGSKNKIYLHKTPDATNADIFSARVIVDEAKRVSIEIVFTKEGAKKIATLSDEHKDKPVAILIDGKVISAPTLRGNVSEKALISGQFTKEEADTIVAGIISK